VLRTQCRFCLSFGTAMPNALDFGEVCTHPRACQTLVVFMGQQIAATKAFPSAVK
jgi:hypothetical protein